MENLIDTLQERGLIDGITHEALRKEVEEPRHIYVGFDPTAESLHVGNLVAIMGLAWAQRLGHIPVAVVGGATGMIGDPSGKSHERSLLDMDTIERNLEGIRKNLMQVLDFDHPTAKPVVLNNYDWFKNFSFIDVLRDVGKHFRLGPMLAKDSVKSRMNSEEGMSFTEFTYQVLQGYDFLHLYDNYGVTIQMGGSDQWGNIIAGTDLIRKVRGKAAYGATFPLLVGSDGKKYGKTEKGAVWLSAERLSPYEFYQYFVRIPDSDVIRIMKMLTFMDMDEIAHYEKGLQGEWAEAYAPNTAQKRLAEEITRLVHGDEGLEMALRVTAGAAPGSDTKLDGNTLEILANEMQSATLACEDVIDMKFIDVAVSAGLLKSKGEARRLIRNGGAYLNNKQVKDENYFVKENDLVDGSKLLISSGKKRKMIVRVE